MAEWLGRGLQNLVRRFDSVWYLKKDVMKVASFFLSITESLIRFNIIKKELPNSEQPSFHYSLYTVYFFTNLFTTSPLSVTIFTK